ncbi:MAG: type IV toxin-antitoxin system AbiEi family antitoxin domain-containing protein [Flavobacteriales bacterium]|nr:type IV toxin-antitoxin system AbiEi family antitoxin domain-containing protein [Flavobacteriales bacterium]
MNKGISYRSSELLDGLISRQKEFFTLKEASEILSGRDNSTVRKLLSDMTKRGVIMRIKEGLYHRVPYEQHPDQYFPNWHLTAEAMMQPKEYYIGFYSALNIHGLITQPSMVEQVVTHEQVKPKVQQIRNVRFEFITLSEKRFFGYKKQWIDDFHKVNCSDLEKTFLDCLYKPDYAGGITEITKALYKSREKLQPVKFQDYLEKFNTQVVYKRLGFIIDALGLFPELQKFVAGKISSSYAPLDPSLDKYGNYNSRWGIIDNIDFKTVLGSIKT